MRDYRIAEKGKQNTFRSYDHILERNIGRPSKRTLSRIRAAKRLGIFLTGFAVTLFVLFLTICLNKEPVEASDGIEYVKDYICIEVKDGDSLWSLAKEYKTEGFTSLERLVAEMEEVNGIQKDTLLKPGNKLMVPCYKTIAR